MWKILTCWIRRKEAEQSALKDALEEPLPAGAADIPLDQPLGPWASGGRFAASSAGIVISLLVFRLVFGLGFNLATLLLLIGHLLLAIASGLPDLSGLNRRLHISAEGIRLEKIPRTLVVPWWQVRRVEAKPDLSFIRALGAGSRVTCDCRSLPLAKRKEIILAIRARLPLGAYVEQWPKERQLLSIARAFVFSSAGLSLILAAFVMGVFASGHTLGLRCGVSSHYLQERFSLPNERGCVILRVSGSAEDAGLRQGDLMIEMNGILITSGSQFTIVFDNSDRRDFKFRVIRSGYEEPLTFHVTLGPSAGPFKEDPDDPFFYYLRAKGDTERLHVERDIADYSRAIELAPHFDLAYLYRGLLYDELGDHASALRDYVKAIELSPDLGEAYSILAYSLNPDDIDGAVSNIRKAIQLHECEGGFVKYNVDCAVAYSLVARLEGYSDLRVTMDVANQAIEFFPGLPDPYFELANAYELLGEMDRAREYAKRYLELVDWPYGPLNPARVEHARNIVESGER